MKALNNVSFRVSEGEIHYLVALVMASLTNGMNLMGIDISAQYLVRAAVLAAAVIFDVLTRNRAK